MNFLNEIYQVQFCILMECIFGNWHIVLKMCLIKMKSLFMIKQMCSTFRIRIFQNLASVISGTWFVSHVYILETNQLSSHLKLKNTSNSYNYFSHLSMRFIIYGIK